MTERIPANQRFPDLEWLESIGFAIGAKGEICTAEIVISKFKEFGNARTTLVLLYVSHLGNAEWDAEVNSYNDLGHLEGGVGLTGTVIKTRADVVRLCKVLGVSLWRGRNEQNKRAIT